MSTKTENILDPNSCWNKAENDEPIFVIRANDPAAPDQIIIWANRYMLDKGGYRQMTPEQIAKYNEAMRTAEAMRRWKTEKLKQQFGGDDDIPF